MASSNVCWGIEVGSGAVKALKLERDGDSVRVADFVVIPHKRVLSTPDIDPNEATRLALGALIAQFGDDLKSQTVAMSVPGHAAFARFAKLPPVEQKGVANLVRFEAVQQIPFPIEDVEWDYQTFMSEDSPDIEVGIFAITRDRINELLHVWGDVGLTPNHVTLSPVALYNAIAYDLAFTEKTPGTIILDIGTLSTDLIVAEAGKVWIRTFPLGGHHFTEALASTFKLNYGKAERTKREVETSKHKRHILQALKPVLADLVQDVQRSISYYEDTHPEANLSRLIGVGSSFRLFGLRKLLSQQLQLDVYRL
ncbi:MAG: type IV pilus assembly protein PilM, partial [Phycisphaerales bacterium]|nr:type IV pilus assembly protein PilM [Phycisphaerales bacterium]